MNIKPILMTALLFLAAPAAAEQVQVTRAQLLSVGIEAIETGDAAQARKAVAIADALIRANPKDLDAHALRARAMTILGRPQDARRSAGVIYQNSKIASSRFGAAMLSSKALMSEKDYPAAQIWLRRALQYAQTDAQREDIRKAYGVAKAANPFSATFSFSVAPNSNVNNGSFEDYLLINFFGVEVPLTLSVDAKAMAGYSAEGSTQLSYRLSQSKQHSTALTFSGYGKLNWLSSGARQALSDAAAAETDPTTAADLLAIRGSDFNYFTAAVGLEHKQRIGAGALGTFALSAGREWYGGAQLNDYVTGVAGLSMKTAGGNGQASVSARLQHRFNSGTGRAAITTAGIKAAYGQKLSWGDTLVGTLGYSRTFSQDSAQVYSMPEVGLSYKIAKPIASAKLSFGATYGYRTYNTSPYSASGRQDHRLSAFAEAEMLGLSYMGFTPVVKVQAQRTVSNVNIYSNQSLSGGLFFRTSF